MGTLEQGVYADKRLPASFEEFGDEEAVTQAIADQFVGTEACFKQFFPAAYDAYLTVKSRPSEPNPTRGPISTRKTPPPAPTTKPTAPPSETPPAQSTPVPGLVPAGAASSQER